MKQFYLRTITGIVYVFLVVLSFFVQPIFLHLLFFFFMIVGIREYLKMTKNISINPNVFLTYLFSIVIYLILQLEYLYKDIFPNCFQMTLFVVVTAFFLSCVFEIFRFKKQSIANISATFLPLFWIAFPMGLIGFWAFSYQDANILLAIFIITCANDVLAYCCGSLYGKHPMAKKISPHKTWEGLLSALVLTMALSILFIYLPYFNNEVIDTPLDWMLFALVIIVFGTIGDLVESLFKRTAHVKDSGKILPGHGGILDRCDSLLFSIPSGFLFFMLLKFIAEI